MDGKAKFHFWYWVAAFFGLMAFQYFYTMATQVADIPYSQFETYLKDGKITEVAVSERFIQGSFRDPVDGKPMFVSTRVDPELAQFSSERQFAQHSRG